MASKLTLNSVTIHYLSHAGFLIEKDNHKIVIDPFIEGTEAFKNLTAKLKLSNIPATDIILTHGHFDHAVDAPKLAKLTGAKITASPEIAAWCKKEGCETVSLTVGGTAKFNWGTAAFRYAMHANSTPDGKFVGDCSNSVLLNLDGLKIYHLGDTGLHLDFKLVAEVYKPDVVIIPIGGHFTTDVEEAIIAAKWLKAKHVIPMHYNTFPQINADPLYFKRQVEKDGTATCYILDIAKEL